MTSQNTGKVRQNLKDYRDNPVSAYASKHSLRLIPAQQKLIEATRQLPMCIMLGAPDQLNLLQGFCIAIGAKKTLDIGVFTGYSAMTIALVLPDDGKVVACDINDENFKVGLPFIKEAGVDHKIDFRVGPAIDTLKKLIDNGESETFDFSFIDADKENYDNYYELSLKLLRKGGVLCFDNVLWSGTVCDPDNQDTITKTFRALAAKVHADKRVHVSLLAVGDGTLLAIKL